MQTGIARKLLGKWISKTTCLSFASAFTICFLSIVPLSPAVHAAQGNVQFGVNITTNNSCVVIIRQGGTLSQNAGGNVLSSLNAGGVAGVADVFSLLDYQVTVDPPPFSSRHHPMPTQEQILKPVFQAQALPMV